MDDTATITILISLVSALGIKEIWNIWKNIINNKNKKNTQDEITKDQLTAQVIGELKVKIEGLEVKIDNLIAENIDLHKQLAKMEERLLHNAKSKSHSKRAKKEKSK